MTRVGPEDRYASPLVERYAGEAMLRCFSMRRKIATWRRLWIALAEAERELGLVVTEDQIRAMRQAADSIDFALAAEYERSLRHDVMAHVHAFGDQCPEAKPVLHLGATSCYVGDNADLIVMREALELVGRRLVAVIARLADFARRHRALATLGFTHYQPAQLTTVGKRAALWIWDLVMDLRAVERARGDLRFRGVKGTTGTQASFLRLFGGDHEKVRALERRVAEKMGFDAVYPVTGQTYSRKVDYEVLATLSGVAQSAHKFANDLRLLANRKELEEPFEATQVGSSAMAYKRNPMRAERMTGLARYLMAQVPAAAATAAEQWLERTLDDSSAKRLVVPEAFLAADGILRLYQNIAEGMVVYPEMIARHVAEELPFMATENILMAAVEAGGDRQTLHEVLRTHSQAAAKAVKLEGKPNDLLGRLKGEPALAAVDIDAELDPARFIGRAPEQVDAFLADVVDPLLAEGDEAGGEPALEARIEI